MDAVYFFTLLVTIFQLLLTIVGLPAFIIKNYHEKRVGQPFLTIAIAIGSYISQIGLFILLKTYQPIIAFGFGLLIWTIILIQWFMYNKLIK